MSEYTPEIWEWRIDDKYIHVEADGYSVCLIDYDDVDHDEAESVADLICAAPTLLEALKELLEAHDEFFGEDACDCMPEPENHGHVCHSCKARAAIAEAEGADR